MQKEDQEKKKILLARLLGSRKRGRPRQSCRDEVDGDVRNKQREGGGTKA